ncbi:MAG: ATP synthase F1 subunit delta [Microbacteriaceae bacterium]
MGSATRTALQQLGAHAENSSKKSNLGLAGELFAAQNALGSSGQLLSVIADAAIEPEQKKALLDSLFPSFGAEAKKILLDAATASWSRKRDLLSGLETSGIRIATGAESEHVVDELYALLELVSTNAELELALNDKLAEPATRSALVEQLFAKQLSPATLAIVQQLVAQPRGRRFTKLIHQAAEIVAEHGGFEIAKVTVAKALSAEKLVEIEKDLSEDRSKKIKAIQVVTSGALGGIRVQLGHEVLDGTIAARLQELRLQLAK